MATRINDAQGSRAIGSHMPLAVALAVIPSLPRPVLSRLVARAIERLDEMDGDPDLEPGDEPGPCYWNDGQPGDEEDAEEEHDAEPEHDIEIEQMQHDVPCLPVYELEPDPATGARKCLGVNGPGGIAPERRQPWN